MVAQFYGLHDWWFLVVNVGHTYTTMDHLGSFGSYKCGSLKGVFFSVYIDLTEKQDTTTHSESAGYFGCGHKEEA